MHVEAACPRKPAHVRVVRPGSGRARRPSRSSRTRRVRSTVMVSSSSQPWLRSRVTTHDLGALGLARGALQRLADALRGEVLVLDVDVVAARARSCRGRAPRPRARRRVLGRGAVREIGNADVAPHRADVVGPRIAAPRAWASSVQLLAGRVAASARSATRRERPRGLAVDRHHHVVEGRIGLAVERAADRPARGRACPSACW